MAEVNVLGETQTGHADIQEHDLQLVRQIGDVSSFVDHRVAHEGEAVFLGNALLRLDDVFRQPSLELEQHIEVVGADRRRRRVGVFENRIFVEELPFHLLEILDLSTDGTHDFQDLVFDLEETEKVVAVDGDLDGRSMANGEDVVLQPLGGFAGLTEDQLGETRLLFKGAAKFSFSPVGSDWKTSCKILFSSFVNYTIGNDKALIFQFSNSQNIQ